MGTPWIRQRKVNPRLLLLTCGFTRMAAGIPAWKIKPVLINSDSRCLELKIRSCWLPLSRVGTQALSSCGQIPGLPWVSPSLAPILFPNFLWRWLDLLWRGRILPTEPECCWKHNCLHCSSPGLLE